MERKFAAQLSTVHKEMQEHGVRAIFEKIKEMGYAGVQLSVLPQGYDPHEVASALKDNELGAAGFHVLLEKLQADLPGILAEADLYGTKDIICPFIPGSKHNEAGIKQFKEDLIQIARDAPGYRISYHNHAFEFDIDVEGQEALAYILDPVIENPILAEIDVYWVKKGGFDPLEYIRPYANRMPIIHLKDMTKDDRETFAEVGEGSIDFIPILEWGEANGVEWYAVEQDVCERPPLESLEISLRNLQAFAREIKEKGLS